MRISVSATKKRCICNQAIEIETKVRTNYGKPTFAFTSIKIWNELPHTVKTQVRPSTFKRSLRSFLTNHHIDFWRAIHISPSVVFFFIFYTPKHCICTTAMYVYGLTALNIVPFIGCFILFKYSGVSCLNAVYFICSIFSLFIPKICNFNNSLFTRTLV